MNFGKRTNGYMNEFIITPVIIDWFGFGAGGGGAGGGTIIGFLNDVRRYAFRLWRGR